MKLSSSRGNGGVGLDLTPLPGTSLPLRILLKSTIANMHPPVWDLLWGLAPALSSLSSSLWDSDGGFLTAPPRALPVGTFRLRSR